MVSQTDPQEELERLFDEFVQYVLDRDRSEAMIRMIRMRALKQKFPSVNLTGREVFPDSGIDADSLLMDGMPLIPWYLRWLLIESPKSGAIPFWAAKGRATGRPRIPFPISISRSTSYYIADRSARYLVEMEFNFLKVRLIIRLGPIR